MAADTLQDQLVSYLADVHASEESAVQQLKTGADAVEDEQLATVLRDHLRETEEHERLVRELLEAYDAGPSAIKDLAQRGGALASGALAKAAPDTTGKVAIQAYAFEHLEIASYRMLRTVAERLGDSETVAVADRILSEEKSAASKLDALLEQAALVSLPQTSNAG